MKIKSMKLRQFRNIDEALFNASEGLNIFLGDNGQGKTNLLEAIVYLSSARSFRVMRDIYTIQHDKDFALIQSVLTDQSEKKELKLVISEAGKHFQVNGQTLSLMSDFIGHCNVVLFNPDDIAFFTSSPSLRRREIDYELGKINGDYLQNLSQFNHLVKERNNYLKEKNIDLVYLEVLTQGIIKHSIPIIQARKKYIDQINLLINPIFSEITTSQSKLKIDYQVCVNSMDDLERQLTEMYAKSLERDLRFKMTHQGIHREDFIFYMDGINVIHKASQGQKRLIILSYKLAISEMIFQRNQHYPILCLDDLFSELDEKRRRTVLEFLPESMQVFITTTDEKFIETNKAMKVFRVRQGFIDEEVSYG